MNPYFPLLFLHVAAVVVWIGGMFFAYHCLRPAAVEVLAPPLRLNLWRSVFARFFVWVWICVVLIPASGTLLMAGNEFAAAPLSWRLMAALGSAMIAVFMYVFFVPYRRLRAAVAREDWTTGGAALVLIRRAVGANLLLALATVLAATAGRYGF